MMSFAPHGMPCSAPLYLPAAISASARFASEKSRPESFIASCTIAGVIVFSPASCMRAHRTPGASVAPRPTLAKCAMKRRLVSFTSDMPRSMQQKNLEERVEVGGRCGFDDDAHAGRRMREGDATRVQRLAGTLARERGERWILDVAPPRLAVLLVADDRPAARCEIKPKLGAAGSHQP